MDKRGIPTEEGGPRMVAATPDGVHPKGEDGGTGSVRRIVPHCSGFGTAGALSVQSGLEGTLPEPIHHGATDGRAVDLFATLQR